MFWFREVLPLTGLFPGLLDVARRTYTEIVDDIAGKIVLEKGSERKKVGSLWPLLSAYRVPILPTLFMGATTLNIMID